MDAVFKTLANPTRRALLDTLFAQDGQTLSALEEPLPDDPLRRHEAPQRARVRRSGRRPQARAREAALPQPRPHPARSTTAGSASTPTRGPPRSPSSRQTWRRPMTGARRSRSLTAPPLLPTQRVRDLHQDHPRTALAGDHRPRGAREVQLRLTRPTRTVRPAPRYGAPASPAWCDIADGRERLSRSASSAGADVCALWSEEVQSRRLSLSSPLTSLSFSILAVSSSLSIICLSYSELRALRRLSVVSLRPQDAALDSLSALHTRLADVRRALINHLLRHRAFHHQLDLSPCRVWLRDLLYQVVFLVFSFFVSYIVFSSYS